MANRFLTSSQGFNNIARTLSISDSPSLKAISNLQESLHIENYLEVDSIKDMQRSMQQYIDFNFESFKGLQETLSFNNLVDSSFIDSWNEYQKNLIIEDDAYKSLIESIEVSNLMDSDVYKSLQDSLNIANGSLGDALRGFNQSLSIEVPFQDIAQMVVPIIDLPDFDKLVVDHLDIYALKSTILSDLDIAFEDNSLTSSGDLSTGAESIKDVLDGIKELKEFHLLSQKDKGRFIYLFNNYIYQLLLGLIFLALSIYLTNAQNELQNQLHQADSKLEVKRIINGIGTSDKKNLLKGYRVTIGHGVNLREGPTKKSQSILILPIGKLLDVIDKSNRSWLYVQVEIEGELINGWVSRRYTTYFK